MSANLILDSYAESVAYKENVKIILFILGLSYMHESILHNNEYLFICSYIILTSI